MKQVFWRPSRQFSGTRSALHWWRNARGLDLPLRGFVWIFHGIGEYGGRYDELAHFLTQFDLDVLAPDWPGHGLSRSEGGQKNLVALDKICQEFREGFENWNQEGPLSKRSLAQIPWFIVSHSMGSLVALKTILDGKNKSFQNFAERAFVIAPPLVLKMPVPAWKIYAAQFLSKISPYAEIHGGIEPEYLSHDAAILAQYRQDPLIHPYASPELFLSMNGVLEEILGKTKDIEIPLCLAVGGLDPIVSPEAIKDYYEKIGTHKKYIEYPGYRHEILNEIHRDRVFKDIVEWLL